MIFALGVSMKGLLLMTRLTDKNKLKKDIKNSYTRDVNEKVMVVVVVKTVIRFKPGGSKIKSSYDVCDR
jgi:hypothetical protein